MLLALYGTRQS